MTRINDRLLVQRADDVMVLMDESTGAEIVFAVGETADVCGSLAYLATRNVHTGLEVKDALS